MSLVNRLVAVTLGSATLVLLVGAHVVAQAPTPVTLRFSGGRAIADATEALQKQYAFAITYEDPEWTSLLDMRDITAQVSKHPESGHQIIAPVGPPFQFQYTVRDGKPDEDPLTLLRRLLAEYASHGGPVFDVQERIGQFGKEWNVKPVRFRNSSDQFVDQPALLDNIINIPHEKRAAMDFIAEICQQLSQASGHHVTMGNVPDTALGFLPFDFGATNRPARDVLADLLESRGFFTWRLLNDPGLHWDVLNIHAARPLTALPAASAPPLSRDNPTNKPPGQPRMFLPRLYGRLNTPEGISAIQTALASAGYYKGQPTGAWDPTTVEAMKLFQTANGIKPTGTPDPASLHKLNLDTEATVPNPQRK